VNAPNYKEKIMSEVIDTTQDPIISVEKERVIGMYERMLQIRTFETRENTLIATEQEGFAHSYVGEEAIAVGVCAALRDNDYISSTHRGHGHMIAKGGDMGKMMAELYGKTTGYCKGKSGSLHIADFNLGVLGANGIVSAGIPIAVGAGYSIRLRKTDQVSVAFFGEGAMNQGTFHEAANMAAVYNLPVIFVVEVNHWQCGVRYETVYKKEVRDNISVRAAAYGMPGENIDGNDVIAVYKAASKAVERARSGNGPSMLACYTYRIDTHFMGDIDIRPKDEIDYWKARDPIDNLERRMLNARILSGNDMEEYHDRISIQVEEAIDFGRQSLPPEPEVGVEHVYAAWPEKSPR
jgi:acetoin:2,6-dichlorophenolindophenol oxidoreductase subunit alpha